MKLINKGSESSFLADIMQKMGFSKPTPIQEQAIPLLLQSETVDFHGQAQTGTGKTLAFGIPLLQKIDPSIKQPQSLIIVPTRELVVQITASLKTIPQKVATQIVAIYGGVPLQGQIAALHKGAHIIVGTPGRLQDLIKRKKLKVNNIRIIVLDEADIMLDMGFKDDIDYLLSCIPAEKNIWLFSATIKKGIEDIKRTHMKNPISVNVSKQSVSAQTITHSAVTISSKLRMKALGRFIESIADFYGFVFCPTKILTSEIAEKLVSWGFNAAALHGDMSQAHRNKVIQLFKDKKVKILVATDVAARGIDIIGITHVINYTLPEDIESYIHRVGRTGRACTEGNAITFINQKEMNRLRILERKFQFTAKSISVPNDEHIISARLARIDDYLKKINQKSDHLEKATSIEKQREVIQTHLSHYTSEEKSNLLAHCLQNIFFSSLLGNEAEFVEVQSKLGTKKSHDKKMDDRNEIALSIGSDDGLTKQELNLLFKNTASISLSQCKKIKILRRRTFVIMKDGLVDTVLSVLNGKQFNKRRIRAYLTNS